MKTSELLQAWKNLKAERKIIFRAYLQTDALTARLSDKLDKLDKRILKAQHRYLDTREKAT